MHKALKPFPFLAYNGLVGICTAVILFATVGQAHAQNFGTVNCNADGKDLQKKIDTASPGAELLVSGDCSDGPYNIEKDVSLIGDGTATLSAFGGGPSVVKVYGASVFFQGLNIDAIGTNFGIATESAAIAMNNVTVENSSHSGVFIAFNSHADINDSTVRNNNIGINVTESSTVEVTNTLVE